jgi:uncharacterized membrane protein
MLVRPVGRFVSFVKSTVIGGVFVLAPLVLLSIVIGHAVQIAFEVVSPVVAFLPVKSVGSVSLAALVGIAAVVAICFVAGLVARTAVSRWLVDSLEQVILSFVPSYGLMKSMGRGWVGEDGDDPHPSVLVRLDDAWQIGFAMDTLPEGRLVVFIPDVPTPWSGTLMIVDADRVEQLSLSTKHTIECLRKLGVNASQVLKKAQAA